jgi:hypothetical protein
MSANRLDDPPAHHLPPKHDGPQQGGPEQGGPENGQATGPEAFGQAISQLEELSEYLGLYLSAKLDALLAGVRRFGLVAVAAIVGLLVVSGMLATAGAIAVLGVAQLIGEALGERLWAGYLITGFGLMAVVGAALWGAMRWLARSFRRKTVEKYARRHEAQRARFGHDARSR